jgi:mannosylglycoprotein endo-beta-mannosidase
MNNSWPLNAWLAKKAGAVHDTGQTISSPGYKPVDWIDAVVPGTVLTTLLKNGVPGHFGPGFDPYFGKNSHSIPDISDPGSGDFYTYWFRGTFKIAPLADGGRVWLYLRGINYSAQVYVNGVQLKGSDNIFLDNLQSSGTELRGMFLRNAFDITALVRQQDALNALAILVNPPNPPGTPSPKDNGGNPDDPNIGENVTMRYTVGWDWVMPIPDRNTGIWDQAMICTTGPVLVLHPHVVTTVLDANGRLLPDAKVKISAEVYNASEVIQTGVLTYSFAGLTRSSPLVTLLPKQKQTVTFSALTVTNPRLWWPNGYGPQELYPLDLSFETHGVVSDTKSVRVGIRQISTSNESQSRVFSVNGQRIFIKGGNWIGTDAMLRLSNKRFRDEVRLHAEMNLNFIRVWGGGIAERPEFYDACDEYGILVMQDFWISGEFTGPFPEGYSQVFLNCARDTIRMLRNHPSLCFWSGGNEAEPPSDINTALRCYIQGDSGCAGYELLDGTRIYVPLSLAIDGGFGGGDGPYGIQDPRDFFALQSCPINPEVGSVGTPTVESIKRMMLPDDYNDFPQTVTNATWTLHKYIPYSNPDQGQLVPCTNSQPRPLYDQIAAYGNLSTVDQFCFRAQLTNYMQYKALFEGFLAHMWEWYAGVFVWKSQNPWTGLRGQLYDWYLGQTGGFYGTMSACEMVHIQLNLETSRICVVNHSGKTLTNLTALVKLYNLAGVEIYNQMSGVQVAASSVYTGNAVKWPANLPPVYFVKMYLLDNVGSVLSENIYWQSSSTPPDYKALQTIPQVTLKATVRISLEGDEYVLNALFGNPASSGAVAFFIQLRLLRPSTPSDTDNRILPAFYEDNYFSLLRGEQKSVTIRCAKTDAGPTEPELWVEGWNIAPLRVPS